MKSVLEIFQLALNWGEEWQCWGVFLHDNVRRLSICGSHVSRSRKNHLFPTSCCWSTSSHYCRQFELFDIDSESQICLNKTFRAFKELLTIPFSASTYLKATKPLTKFWYPTLCKARSVIQTDKSSSKRQVIEKQNWSETLNDNVQPQLTNF